MAKKKMTVVEKKERAKLANEITSKQMMRSSRVNGNIIQGIHDKTNFGVNALGESIKLDLKSLVDEMESVSEQVRNGDLSSLEDMLVCQTYSLQHMFTNMALKISCTSNAEHIDLLSKLALKAQNQCRSTVATLSEMKNPKRATFIKQQNNAVNQQINQDKNSKNLDKPANELLEQAHGKRLDSRATQETIGAHQGLETVGESNRS